MNANTIMGLSLWQPYATLIAIGAKKIETRSWPTRYRGRLAIHAGQTFDWESQALVNDVPIFRRTLHAGLLRLSGQMFPGRHSLVGRDVCASDLPTGAFLATCRLVNCIRTESDRWHAVGPGDRFR